MFLSDVSDNVALFRRKRYEEYLRENKPEVYNSLTETRRELSDFINKQRVNPSSKKPVVAVVVPKRNGNILENLDVLPENLRKITKTKNTYKVLKEMGYQNTSRNNIRSGLRDLKRFEPLPNLKNTLPNLSNTQRGVKPLPILQPTTRPVLPDLNAIPTRWNKPSFDVLASKHDARGIVNPVKDTFIATSGRKPITQTIVPKAPKPNTKETKKLLKTLGVAGVVGGGILGAYGLKKYNENKKRKK